MPRLPDEIMVEFQPEERERLHRVCRALRTSYKDFIEFATMQAVSECEGYGDDAALIRRFYEGPGF